MGSWINLKKKKKRNWAKTGLKNTIKTPQTLEEYGFNLLSQPASQDLLQWGYTCRVQSHFTRSEELIKHSRFSKGSQQVGKLHLPECNISMPGTWMDATFWHEMTGRGSLNYWTMPMQRHCRIKRLPCHFHRFSFLTLCHHSSGTTFCWKPTLGNFSTTWLTRGILQTSSLCIVVYIHTLQRDSGVKWTKFIC